MGCFFFFLAFSLELQASSCSTSLQLLSTDRLFEYVGRGQESKVYRLNLSSGKAIAIKFLRRLSSSWSLKDRQAKIKRKLFIQRKLEEAGIPHKPMHYWTSLGIAIQTYTYGYPLSDLIRDRDQLRSQGEDTGAYDQVIEEGKEILRRAVDAVGPALEEAYRSGELKSRGQVEAESLVLFPDISFGNLVIELRDGQFDSRHAYLIDW